MGANIDENNDGIGSVTFYVGTNAGNLAAIPECAGMLLTGFTAPNNTVTCTGSTTLNALKKGGSYLVAAVYSGDRGQRAVDFGQRRPRPELTKASAG